MGNLSGPRLVVRRWSRVTIRPATFAWQRNRCFGPNLMTGSGTEFEDFQSAPEQIDVVDGLRALITAIEAPPGKYVAAVRPANPDVLRPQRDAHLVAGFERVQQRRLPSPAVA